MSRFDYGAARPADRGTSVIRGYWSLVLISAVQASTMGCGSSRVTAPTLPCTLPVLAAAEVDSTFRLITMLEPVYPREAIRQGHQGAVLVRTIVDHDGSVCEVAVHSSSGYTELDSAAVAAARTARFTLVWSRGRAVRAELVMPIEFRLARLRAQASRTRMSARKVVRVHRHNKPLHPANADHGQERFDTPSLGARG